MEDVLKKNGSVNRRKIVVMDKMKENYVRKRNVIILS
jgi:hypothetical protein